MTTILKIPQTFNKAASLTRQALYALTEVESQSFFDWGKEPVYMPLVIDLRTLGVAIETLPLPRRAEFLEKLASSRPPPAEEEPEVRVARGWKGVAKRVATEESEEEEEETPPPKPKKKKAPTPPAEESEEEEEEEEEEEKEPPPPKKKVKKTVKKVHRQ